MKTLMIDMDNVITDGKVFELIESRINRKIEDNGKTKIPLILFTYL